MLDAGQQRTVLWGVEEIARGLVADPGPASGQAGGGTPQITEDLRALFETRLRWMAAQGPREEAVAPPPEVLGDEHAEAIAAAVIPEESMARETPTPAETLETPEKSGTVGEHEPDSEPQTDAERKAVHCCEPRAGESMRHASGAGTAIRKQDLRSPRGSAYS